ncbi:MAG: hypothetical protein EXQ59_02755 [Acidobacteria bacterium]|nr:hypothetical protein [Acidobacteriota bacterium]
MAHRIAARTALATLVCAWSVVLAAQQAGRGPSDALMQRASDRLRALHQEAGRLVAEERTLIGDLRRLEVDRQIKREELAEVVTRTEATALQLSSANDQLARLEREDLAERPALSARLVALYKMGKGRYLRTLLSVSDVSRLGRATRMVTTLADRDRQRIAAYRQRLDQLKAARISLQTQAAELTALRLTADRARAAADRALDARNALIATIDSARDLNAALAGELAAAQQKLQATIGAVASGAAPVEATLPLRPFRGDLDWPIAGALRRGFAQAIGGRPAGNGIEIAGAEGAPVVAIHGGTVAFAETFTGFGKLVIVDHGGDSFSVYGNLLDIAVLAGAKVAHGDVLGAVGPSLTAASTAAGAAGLYFELRIDGRPVDPVQWLKRR